MRESRLCTGRRRESRGVLVTTCQVGWPAGLIFPFPIRAFGSYRTSGGLTSVDSTPCDTVAPLKQVVERVFTRGQLFRSQMNHIHTYISGTLRYLCLFPSALLLRTRLVAKSNLWKPMTDLLHKHMAFKSHPRPAIIRENIRY